VEAVDQDSRQNVLGFLLHPIHDETRTEGPCDYNPHGGLPKADVSLVAVEHRPEGDGSHHVESPPSRARAIIIEFARAGVGRRNIPSRVSYFNQNIN